MVAWELGGDSHPTLPREQDRGARHSGKARDRNIKIKRERERERKRERERETHRRDIGAEKQRSKEATEQRHSATQSDRATTRP